MIFVSGPSMIGTIIPDVVSEEVHGDRMQVTQHPVEQGGTVSDHAFMLPQTLEMKIGFGDSARGPGSSRAAYEGLLALQRRREPFNVSTGKRNYKNMLVVDVSVPNDYRTPYSVMASVRIQEVRIVTTQSEGTSTPSGFQGSPADTAGQQNLGSINPVGAFGTSGPTDGGIAALPGAGGAGAFGSVPLTPMVGAGGEISWSTTNVLPPTRPAGL
jgi:hypothetical protein